MSFVGIPFADGGRDRTGCDCWGLVRLFLSEAMGIAGLPDYGETPASDLAGSENALAKARNAPLWRQVEQPSRGDVVVMWCFERDEGRRLIKTLRHVGVMLDGRRLLHIQAGTDSVAIGVDHPSVRDRIESFWRHCSC